jgi:hypothetical protein
LRSRRSETTVTRVDHFGIIVPNLDEAHAFFVDVLGSGYLYTLGPLRGYRQLERNIRLALYRESVRVVVGGSARCPAPIR